MSDDKSSTGDGGDGNSRRNLPSWMNSRQAGNKSERKKPADAGKNEAQSSNSRSKEAKFREKTTCSGEAASSSAKSGFSKLMDGVVFVLSGFVNPERGLLRSQALEMGAEYQQDWNSECTLLICAFSNTPKFRQVETDCGTIVSKKWITECYNQKKLVDIDTYLMHPGKPWRKNKLTTEDNQGNETTPPREPQKQAKKSSNPKPVVSVSTKGKDPSPVKEQLSPSKVKSWAMEDLKKTITWLESQDETPEPGEVKKIAAEGILTCLQDAIESLEQNQDIQQVTEQWRFIPRVVEELVGLVDKRNSSSSSSLSQKDLCKQAVTCKRIYQTEFDSLHDDSNQMKKKQKGTEGSIDDEKTDIQSRDAGYNSDETLEMTEEEIDLAYNTVASKISKWFDMIYEPDENVAWLKLVNFRRVELL